ncbi:MAG TPA: hypothetical protein VI306_05390 [Pyrinomonadaceae bacterium]
MGEVFGGIGVPTKHSAKVVCHEGSVWIAPKQFWRLVRDNIIEYISEPPLTGKFKGQPADFLVTVNHTVLSMACPEHRQSVLISKRYTKR